jgi:hypothetical protein
MTGDLACLNCGILISIIVRVEENNISSPAPGDLMICAHCGHTMALTDGTFGFRELTKKEMKQVKKEMH